MSHKRKAVELMQGRTNRDISGVDSPMDASPPPAVTEPALVSPSETNSTFTSFQGQSFNPQVMFQSQDHTSNGYMLVPTSYMQQTQMMISQMYSQITALTVAQNALQQAFQMMQNQRSEGPRGMSSYSGLPDLNDPNQVSRWISEKKMAKIELVKSKKIQRQLREKSKQKSKAVCSYFLKGNCSKGNRCPFKHSKKDSKPSESKAEEVLKIYDFNVDTKGDESSTNAEPMTVNAESPCSPECIDETKHE